eukprot:1015810-Rhodomonas_salina.1
MESIRVYAQVVQGGKPIRVEGRESEFEGLDTSRACHPLYLSAFPEEKEKWRRRRRRRNGGGEKPEGGGEGEGGKGLGGGEREEVGKGGRGPPGGGSGLLVGWKSLEMERAYLITLSTVLHMS